MTFLAVQCARWLIREEGGGIFHDGTCVPDALLFAALREAAAFIRMRLW